jgi:cell division transport system permease protein
MLGTEINRAVKSGFKNFFRNGWLSLATTSVMALALFIISFLLSLIFVSNRVLAEIQDKISISVYFNQTASEEKIIEIKGVLEKMAEVKGVTFVSSDKALEVLKEKYQGNEIIIESLRELGENPLEASLGIKVYDTGKYEFLENNLLAGKFKDYISKLDYSDHKKEIDRLNKIIVSVRKMGIFVSLLFVIIAVLVTFNSIRLTMYTHREEVEIMRLVGASNWFIRLPFIVEGVLYGAFGSLVVFCVLFPFANYLTPFFLGSGANLNPGNLLRENFFPIFFLQMFIGVALGGISSVLAIRRYLKV